MCACVFLQKEVTSALPKLIKLNPMVVKEVFNRLMGAHSEFWNWVLFSVIRKMYASIFAQGKKKKYIFIIIATVPLLGRKWCTHSPWYNGNGWLGIKHQVIYLPGSRLVLVVKELRKFIAGQFDWIQI